MAVLPGVLGCSFDRLPETTLPETSSGQAGQAGQAPPATYRSGTPRNQHPAVARWHTHLRGLATAIHEISGLVIYFAEENNCELLSFGVYSFHLR